MTLALRAGLRGLALREHGAELAQGAADAVDRRAILAALAAQPSDAAGIRLFGVTALRPFLATDGLMGRLASTALGRPARPVRAILFDKTPAANWALAWHQDRVIAVTERRDVEGFGPWTRKHGVLHVGPPYAVLAGMVTLRLHLDPTPDANAPLLAAPGSHRLGRIAEADIAGVVRACGMVTCLADAGDVWIYATPILHASEAARLPTRRRVLQVDYAADDLPGGLAWAGV